MEETKKKKLLQWHPGFYAGLQIELAEDADNLTFENEHQLGTKPKQIDVLIIKKDSTKPIRKKLGRIFRKYNIVEYKGPEDYLSIDDFYKVYGYTCFYKADGEGVNGISVEELTITYVCHRYPRKVIQHLKEQNYRIRNMAEGIYYVEEMFFPIQIILTSELSKEENLWLGSLTNQLEDMETARKLVEEYGRHKQDSRYESVMDLIANANRKLFKEVNHMCEALKEIVREDMQSEFDASEQKGKNEGIAQMECLIRHLIATSRFDEIERAVNDKDYQKHLFEEFGL